MDATPDHSHPQVVADRAFAALIRDARRKPFEWGTHDCVLFAAAAIRARTGREALAELGIEPTWSTALQATSAIVAAGGLRAAFTQLFGEPVSALQACPGDIALIADPEHPLSRELLAVVHSGMVLAPSAAGLAAVPLSAVRAAWRVA